MDVVDQAVTTESAPVTTESAPAPTSAGTQNTEQAAPNGQFRGFHEHPDWQRMVAERRQERALLAQMRQELQRYQQTQQPTSQRPALDPEKAAAIQALKGLIGEDDDLKGALGAPKEIAELKQTVNTLLQVIRGGALSNGRKSMTDSLTSAGLSPEAASQLEDYVAGYIAINPALRQRFEYGDATAVEAALEGLKKVLGSVTAGAQRQKDASTAQTKLTGTATVPPRASGGPPGPSAPEKPTPANHAQKREELRERFRSAFSSLTGQQG